MKGLLWDMQPDGRIGMNVGHWLDTMGIHNPSKAKVSVPRMAPQAAPTAQPDLTKQTPRPGAASKRIRRAPNPEKHLGELKALLESHGERTRHTAVPKCALTPKTGAEYKAGILYLDVYRHPGRASR